MNSKIVSPRFLTHFLALSCATWLNGCALNSDANVSAETASIPQGNAMHESDQENQANSINANADATDEGVATVNHPEQEVVVALEPEIPTPVTDVWVRVAHQMAFEIPDNKRIAAQRRWYLNHPDYMQRVMQRGSPFLYYIVGEIEARNMPLELALLPIVESAFDPFAYSHGRAAGMWQFIPGTAKRFGMKQTWWYDGRRDVVNSTQGALDYLTYLNTFFDGNWLHALAAYNSGEGRVRKAIRRNKKLGKPTDFWSLDLPRETRAYVPKLLALADILANQQEYAFEWPSVDNTPVIGAVDTGSQIDLALAANLANMTLDSLHALNPGLNRWATDPDGPHRLVLPIDRLEGFEQALDELPSKARLKWVRHKVRSGDSLIKLASKYHTTVDLIQEVNNIKGNRIVAGKHLMVPVAQQSLESYALSSESRLAATQNRQRSGTKIEHTVTNGDTFWDLSRTFRVSVRNLAKWNGMAPTDPLMPGKTLVIWQNHKNDDVQSDAIVRKVIYKVRRGDSLARIASKFGIRTNDIVRWNNLNPKRYLQPGQTLTLHIDVTATAG